MKKNNKAKQTNIPITFFGFFDILLIFWLWILYEWVFSHFEQKTGVHTFWEILIGVGLLMIFNIKMVIFYETGMSVSRVLYQKAPPNIYRKSVMIFLFCTVCLGILYFLTPVLLGIYMDIRFILETL